jgi:hypothetical protein
MRITMDHAEALEQIEIAAAEPEGLERLMAGDTSVAAAVAGHLAGCEACAAELVRLRRVAEIARAVIAEEPDPALRERTLAYVRALGVERQAAAGTSTPPASAATADAAEAAGVAGTPPVDLRTRRRLPVAWLAGIAASLLLVGVAGYGLGGGFEPEAPHDDSPAAVLADAARTAVDLASEPGTQVVQLAATPAGGDATGRLAFNGGSGELVMVATGLAAPGDRAEYRCWLEIGGERRRIGTMYAAGDDRWAWSGPADGLDAAGAGAVFGVSLVPADGTGAEAVLTGGI